MLRAPKRSLCANTAASATKAGRAAFVVPTNDADTFFRTTRGCREGSYTHLLSPDCQQGKGRRCFEKEAQFNWGFAGFWQPQALVNEVRLICKFRGSFQANGPPEDSRGFEGASSLAFLDISPTMAYMSSRALFIQNLRVDFPDVIAVNDVSFNIDAGDVCGLIGPNGAGKTTTMRAICGLQEWTNGSVKVAGYDLASEPEELKRQLGFMPDFCPTYDQLTAWEFLDHFGRAYGVPKRTERIKECLDITWLTEKRDALCEALSRGMKQRLVLARTLLPDPKVLLLDEPASGLDPLGRMELRKLLLQLREAGKAVLISSHILTELSGFCNKAAIMERGRLVMFGGISELGQKLAVCKMSVKWRGDGSQASAILRAANVRELEVAGESATFVFNSGPDALDELLKTLVVRGVRVSEWRPVGDDLEQIFLRSGAKELM